MSHFPSNHFEEGTIIDGLLLEDKVTAQCNWHLIRAEHEWLYEALIVEGGIWVGWGEVNSPLFEASTKTEGVKLICKPVGLVIVIEHCYVLFVVVHLVVKYWESTLSWSVVKGSCIWVVITSALDSFDTGEEYSTVVNAFRSTPP